MQSIEIPVALSPEFITQVTEENSRYYVRNGLRHTSVTTIISATLRAWGVESWKAKWIAFQLEKYNGKKLSKTLAHEIITASDKEMKSAATLGTHMHNIIERLLKDEDVNDVPEQLEPAVQAWLKWRRHHIEWELVGTEVGIYGEMLRPYKLSKSAVHYAGQIDALFKISDNHYVVVDWKTSSGLFDSSFIQVAAYAKAIERKYESDIVMHPNIKCDAMIVRMVGDYPKIECTEHDNIPAHKAAKCKHGEKIRTEPKIFNGKVQFARVDVDHWANLFDNLLAIHGGKNAYVTRQTL